VFDRCTPAMAVSMMMIFLVMDLLIPEYAC